MRYSVDSRIFARFPGFRRAVVVAENIDNRGQSEELLSLLRRAEEEVRGEALASFPDLPKLNIWVEAFRVLGLNPKKHPPSIVNMIKRVRSGKDLPYINTLVAIFNWAALHYTLSCGGDDLATVRGNLILTEADGSEFYSPLGQPEVREHPAPGEVIYMDDAAKEIFCRAWCWKNGDPSKLLPETRRAAINIDGMLPAFSLEELLEIAEQVSAKVRQYTGAATRIELMSPERSEFTV